MTVVLEWPITGVDPGAEDPGWSIEWGDEWGTSVGDVDPGEYARALQQLLPPGAAWNFGDVATSTTTIAKILRGLARAAAHIEDRTRQLLDEIDPRTTVELLEDWEGVLGLPEECGTPPATIEGRQAALHAKMTSRAVGTVPFFVNLAAKLGYPAAEVHRMNRPFRAGSRAGDRLYGTAGGWVNAFLLLPNATTENDGTLQCLVRSYAQAHEVPIFEAPGSWEPPED